MYSSENSSFDIKDIIVKILFLVLFVLILMWLYPKVDLGLFYDRVYNENITAMKDAAISYYTTDRLPKNDGDISEMSLQKMLDLKLLLPFVDKDGNSCDLNNSYVQVTKEGNEYIMKVSLTCGKQSDYIVEYIGCHDVCPNSCPVAPKVDEQTKPEPTFNNNNNNGGNNNGGSNNGGGTVVRPATKYTITVKAVNGTVKSPKIVVKKGNTASTTVRANSGYKYASVSCTNGQKATWSNNTIKVTKVSKSATCTVKFVKKAVTPVDPDDPNVTKYEVKVSVVNGTSDEKAKTVVKNSNPVFNITANSGYDITNTSVSCNTGTVASMDSSKLTFRNVTQDGTCVVIIGKKNYDAYTVNLQVLNGTSDKTKQVVAPNSTIMFKITPKEGYSLNGATVSCGNGLNGTLSGVSLKVANVATNGSCLVILKKASTGATTAKVAKTYYSIGYTSNVGGWSYGIYLDKLPNHVTPSKVVATGIDIVPMTNYSDFSKYVAAKKAGEVSQPGGETGYSVGDATVASLYAHALTAANFSTTARSGCSATRCSAVITNSIKNLDGVEPTGTVTFVNGKKGSGIYYVPVKFVVTFEYKLD